MTPINGTGAPVKSARTPTSLNPRQPTTQPRQRQCTCRCHCRACDRCFAGLESFSAHRQGSHSAPRNSLDGRRCVAIEHDKQGRFEQIDGVCRIAGPGELLKTIWRLTGAAERTQRDFRKAVSLNEPEAVAA